MPGPLIGALRVSLSMDTAAFEKGADLAQRKAAAFGKKMQSMGDKLSGVGTKMTLGITTPLAAFGVSAFKAATDAAELQSAFDQTFGKMSGAMNKWAEATGNAMGRSTREIQEGANAFGLYFNQAAKTREEAAKMSQQFTVLAQDLSSFHNTSVDEALTALRSGLSGEAEPMRRYGVFLNEAAVAAKAAELGFEKVNGKLTDQQKIMARAAIIMEATKNAQGDVARTFNSTANQIRRSKAAWEELQIIVGTKLLPAITPLIEKVASLIDWFVKLPQPVQNTVLAFTAFSAICGPVLLVVGKLLPLITGMGPAFLAFTAALKAAAPALAIVRAGMLALLGNPLVLGAAAAITAIYLAWKNWDKIVPIVQRMVGGVTSWLNKLATPFKLVIDKTKAVGDAFFRLYDRVVGHSYIPDMVSEIGQHIAQLAYNMVQPIQDAVAKSNEAFAGLGENGPLTVMERLKAISGEANEAMKNVALDGIRSLADGLTAVITGTAKLGDVFRSVAQQIISELIRIQIQKMLMSFATSIGIPLPTIPGRATGGPVIAGQPYIVGERGPELFMPKGSGTIVPNHELGGGQSNTFNFSIAGPVTRQTEMQIAAAVRRTISDASKRGY